MLRWSTKFPAIVERQKIPSKAMSTFMFNLELVSIYGSPSREHQSITSGLETFDGPVSKDTRELSGSLTYLRIFLISIDSCA